MLKLGMHVDNWRHLDVSYEVPCQFAADNGMEYVEFGTIDGDYFVQALGFPRHRLYHPGDPVRQGPWLSLRGYDRRRHKTRRLHR